MEVRIENVSGASKYEQKVTRAPSSVTIVTADEIATFGHRTLADVLRSVRGMYLSNDDNYSYLGSRGFLRPGDYNSRTLVLVDGHRINDNIYDQAGLGREGALDVDLIDRVEVIRGPSSSVYGSSAFFGVVNIVTRRGRQLDGWEVAGDAGSLGSTTGRLSFGRLFKNEVELLLSASWFHSDGRAAIYYPEYDQRVSASPRAADNGVAENSDGEDAVNLLGSVTFRDFSISGLYATREKVIPTASFGSVFNTGRERSADSRGYVTAKYAHEFSPQLRLLARASYDSYTYYGTYPLDYSQPGAPPDVVANKDVTVGEWLTAEWQATATLFGRHTLVAGTEVRENLHEKQVNYDDTVPRTYYINDDHRSQILGAYLQGEFMLRSDLLLNAGLRYDHYSGSFGGTTNPRLGLIFNPVPQTTLKMLFGQAYRAPNPYERYYYQYLGPVALKPEKIRTYEVVLEQYFSGDYRAGVSIYRYNVRDLISQVASPQPGMFYFANLDRARANGIELEIEGRVGGEIRARASYAFQHAENETTDRELTNSPRHLAKLNLSSTLWRKRATAAIELQYNGAVHTVAGGEARDFLVGNLTLTAHRWPGGFELSASVYNLFDTRYANPGAGDHLQDVIPQPGRALRFKLSRRF